MIRPTDHDGPSYITFSISLIITVIFDPNIHIYTVS
jgi:hypothetical protein